MNVKLIEIIKGFFHKKEEQEPKTVPAPSVQEAGTASSARLKKTCKKCGKTFSYDPSWDHIPNYCKNCRRQFTQEKEEKQRAGAPRKIKRKCRECGKFFTFPSTLPHYPNYCSNCRKAHQASMKAKYNRKKDAGNRNAEKAD